MIFFEFNQNNSGGHFDVNENVAHRVIIEAETYQEALKKFEPMIKNQSSSCPCCGERWYLYEKKIDINDYRINGYQVAVYTAIHERPLEEWRKKYGQFKVLEEPKIKQNQVVGKLLFENIEDYASYMAIQYGWTTPDIKIHFSDGTIKDIFKPSKN